MPDLGQYCLPNISAENRCKESVFFETRHGPSGSQSFFYIVYIIIIHFFHSAQTATQLVITTKADIKAKHNANFPLEAEVVVEIRDTNGGRVYSGPDSTLVRYFNQSTVYI